jgi:hypothetical protein
MADHLITSIQNINPDGKELPYAYTCVDQLLEDFIAAVETRRAS